jgi:hypothetical protein
MRSSAVNKQGVTPLILPDEDRFLQSVGGCSKLLASFCTRISTRGEDDVTGHAFRVEH